ncbi:MAG: cyclodeaminase/cyclohydrolase family protein [Deltaproteobacteria bacterium]|nr:cyclodeaminase/cyclohydrolase family protein [Deltaproteobacteria bacterium]
MLDNSCKDFISVLASKAPVPGGGGAAALGGAIGMALSNMVGNLTTGKKKYADVEPEIIDLLKRGEKIIEELQNLVDKDAEVFEPLSKAYGLPKNTPEEIKYKEECIEDCSKLACSVPIEIMRRSFEGIKIHARMAQIGTMIAISDVGCGVVFLKSALIAASLNIVINLNTIKDDDFKDKMKKEMDSLISEGSKIADETFDFVMGKLKK